MPVSLTERTASAAPLFDRDAKPRAAHDTPRHGGDGVAQEVPQHLAQLSGRALDGHAGSASTTTPTSADRLLLEHLAISVTISPKSSAGVFGTGRA